MHQGGKILAVCRVIISFCRRILQGSQAVIAKRWTVTLYQSYRPRVAPQVGLEPTTLRLTEDDFGSFFMSFFLIIYVH